MITDLDVIKFSELLANEKIQQALADIVANIVHRKLFGQQYDSYDVDKLAFFAAGISSSDYVVRHMAKAARLANAMDLLQHSLMSITIDGLIMEFGVYAGKTINHVASILSDQKVYGFDSFEGLPETWRPGFDKGAFATNQLPPIRNNIELIVGLFDRTLPIFLESHPNVPTSFLHVDCDIYSSTQIIFHYLKDRIGPGTIIVFDEYYNYPGWEMHEFRAFQEYVKTAGLHYEYIGIVPSHQQVSVRIIG